MKRFLTSRYIYIGITAVVIIFVGSMLSALNNRHDTELVTTIVETGSVRQLVSVSGIAEAEQTAELAFPTGGIVEAVLVEVGNEVQTGDILIKLDARALYADRQDAASAVAQAVANRNELLSGPTDSARDVTTETIASAEEALVTTRENEARKVSNAYHSLLSSDLSAYSNDSAEDATPPTVSGTYSCDTEGDYVLDIFSSGSASGYSYRLTGVETGTYVASTDQAIAMGECGLRVQFNESSRYARTNWIIEIPNTKSSLYVINRNAYALAITQSASAIALAEQAVTLAKASATDQNAPARSEAVTRANAAITQAQARLNKIDTTIADRTLTAPFAGVITEIDILPGETVTTAPVVTLLASSAFEVTARIPEIDISKLLPGQPTEMVFDARTTETVYGDITFVSPQATEIDGVAYYKAIIKFTETPVWMRSGLNADIEIIITEQTSSLRVPKRFVTETKTGYEVLLQRTNTTATSTIEVELVGNDGYYAITGLNEGDILIAP